MEARLYTVHRKGDRGIVFVPDRFDLFALIVPPLWAIWHGQWLILLGMIALAGLAGWYSPLAISPVTYGIGLILALEGGALRRAELRVRGWREVTTVQAASEEGAEELYLVSQPA